MPEAIDRETALRLLRGGPEGVAEWNRLSADKVVIPDLTSLKLPSFSQASTASLPPQPLG